MSRPELTLIQLSDPHIVADPGGRLHGHVDTLAVLESALDTVTRSGAEVHGLLLTGDLTEDGSPVAYRRLRAAVERLGVPIVYAMGNHDDRAAFRGELLDEPGSEPYHAAHEIDGVRIVVLDSTRPGRHDGHLDDDQLEWLRTELVVPAPRGTVLVVHHPPLPSPVPTVHLLRLRDAGRLAECLAGSDVRLVVTGHAHHTGCGALAGIPVWVSPALAYRVEALPPRARLIGSAASGLSRIDLIDGAFVATAVDLGAAAPVYDEDEASRVRWVAEHTAQAG
ncbi:metallophosphoesterase family protein [Amycolatopsis sp. cmx-11-12]|uniref:metallophosphoesterase family protein n=1 Tax=Amycolatopsis sp. cmx-11-12 TaxID=2785795 RepID=UPI003918201C